MSRNTFFPQMVVSGSTRLFTLSILLLSSKAYFIYLKNLNRISSSINVFLQITTANFDKDYLFALNLFLKEGNVNIRL